MKRDANEINNLNSLLSKRDENMIFIHTSILEKFSGLIDSNRKHSSVSYSQCLCNHG